MLRLCVWLERQCHDGKTESGPAGREGGRWVWGDAETGGGWGDSVCMYVSACAHVWTHICIYSIVRPGFIWTRHCACSPSLRRGWEPRQLLLLCDMWPKESECRDNRAAEDPFNQSGQKRLSQETHCSCPSVLQDTSRLPSGDVWRVSGSWRRGKVKWTSDWRASRRSSGIIKQSWTSGVWKWMRQLAVFRWAAEEIHVRIW